MQKQSKKNYWSTPGPYEPHEPKSIIVDNETKAVKVLPVNYNMMEKLGIKKLSIDTKKAAHPKGFFPKGSFGFNKQRHA